MENEEQLKKQITTEAPKSANAYCIGEEKCDPAYDEVLPRFHPVQYYKIIGLGGFI